MNTTSPALGQPPAPPSPNAPARGRPRALSLRLAENEYRTLAALAERHGVTPSRLAETWVYLALVDATEGGR